MCGNPVVTSRGVPPPYCCFVSPHHKGTHTYLPHWSFLRFLRENARNRHDMMTYTHVVPKLHVPRPCTVVAIRTSQMARLANCRDYDFPSCCLLVASHVIPCLLCLRQFNRENPKNKDRNIFNQVSLLAIALRVCGCFGLCYVVLCMHVFSIG